MLRSDSSSLRWDACSDPQLVALAIKDISPTDVRPVEIVVCDCLDAQVLKRSVEEAVCAGLAHFPVSMRQTLDDVNQCHLLILGL